MGEDWQTTPPKTTDANMAEGYVEQAEEDRELAEHPERRTRGELEGALEAANQARVEAEARSVELATGHGRVSGRLLTAKEERDEALAKLAEAEKERDVVVDQLGREIERREEAEARATTYERAIGEHKRTSVAFAAVTANRELWSVLPQDTELSRPGHKGVTGND